MADDHDHRATGSAPGREKPVRSGLVALLGVGLVVGLLVSGAALAVVSVLGLDGESASSTPGSGSGSEVMVLPTPSPTPTATDPVITLAPQPGPGEAAGDGGVDTAAPAPAPEAAPPATGITLNAAQSQVSAGQEIPLDGSYPGGEGATLQVERLDGQTWTEFPVDAQVRDGAFSTFIRTSRTGETRFRMRDVASGATSNEVTVTIS